MEDLKETYVYNGNLVEDIWRVSDLDQARSATLDLVLRSKEARIVLI